MTAYVVLGRARPDGNLELRDVGATPKEHLLPMSQVAQDNGFELMFEFSEPPDMAEVVRHAESDKVGISSMKTMARLWVLTDPCG